MQQFPHHYQVNAQSAQEGSVQLSAENLPAIETAPPAQFGGPGNLWSPEDMLVGSIANCFILTFRAIARASRLEWTSLTCDVSGTLDRVERSTEFTEFTVSAQLTVPGSTDHSKAQTLLEKAEQNCLITNSLKASCHLKTAIQ